MASQAGPRKCANAACTCTVPANTKSKYCSAHCEGIGGKVELMCCCGHGDCTATMSTYAPIEPDQPPVAPMQ